MPDRQPTSQPEPTKPRPPPAEPTADLSEESREADLVDIEASDQALEPRVWSILAHFTLFVIPVIGPLVILGLQTTLLGRRSELVSHHCKQAAIWHLALIVVGIATVGIGAVIMSIFTLYAAWRAAHGEPYAFPIIGDYAANSL